MFLVRLPLSVAKNPAYSLCMLFLCFHNGQPFLQDPESASAKKKRALEKSPAMAATTDFVCLLEAQEPPVRLLALVSTWLHLLIRH